MKKASNYAFIAPKPKNAMQSAPIAQMPNALFANIQPPQEVDLNVFILTFDGIK